MRCFYPHVQLRCGIFIIFAFAIKWFMCKYSEIEAMLLPNGLTAKKVNEAVKKEVDSIYLELWLQGVPDRSEDKVSLNRATRTYTVITRTAQQGRGKHACLLS